MFLVLQMSIIYFCINFLCFSCLLLSSSIARYVVIILGLLTTDSNIYNIILWPICCLVMAAAECVVMVECVSCSRHVVIAPAEFDLSEVECCKFVRSDGVSSPLGLLVPGEKYPPSPSSFLPTY